RSCAMPIALASGSHPRRRRGAERGLELFFDNRIDPRSRSHAKRRLETRHHRILVGARGLPAILRHSVILRHPPPSGRSCWLTTAPDDDALSTFPPESRHYRRPPPTHGGSRQQ